MKEPIMQEYSLVRPATTADQIKEFALVRPG